MNDRALCGIGKEFSSGFSTTLAIGFATLAPPCLSLRQEQSFQFMIARGVSIEIVDGWRRVVHRRAVVPNDSFRFRQFVTRLELQAGNAGRIHSDQMQACRRNLE